MFFCHKKGKSAIIFFHIPRLETNTSLIFHMWQVKMSLEQKKFRLSRGVAGGFWTKFEVKFWLQASYEPT
jgi:hypothetical protein